MAKRVPESELQQLEDLILRYPNGIGIAKLEEELHHAMSRRTLGRRLSDLVKSGRIRRRGELKGALYIPDTTQATKTESASRPAQFQTLEGVSVAVQMSAGGKIIMNFDMLTLTVTSPRASNRSYIG